MDMHHEGEVWRGHRAWSSMAITTHGVSGVLRGTFMANIEALE